MGVYVVRLWNAFMRVETLAGNTWCSRLASPHNLEVVYRTSLHA